MRRWIPVATALAGLVLLGTVRADAQGATAMEAKVPFDFKVGAATLPAGEYDVSYDGAEAPSVLVIRSRDGHHQALVLTEAVDVKPARNARLVFEREGATYVLHEVLPPDGRTGLELLEKHAGA